ncbi:MAG: HAMP domain-containing histidine kinase [Lachnospiraceae bacterium]|nr:HAMP domain-containing histidine kinase [Lachnospiraceae bacterium]
MIKKLRYKFILIASIALLLVQGYMVFMTNTIVMTYSFDSIDNLIDYIADNEGHLPDSEKGGARYREEDLGIETPFETRYFSAVLDENKEIIRMNCDNVAAITEEEAESIAKDVIRNRGRTGIFETDKTVYYYKLVGNDKKMFFGRQNEADQDGGYVLVFVDSSRQIHIIRSVRIISLEISIVSFIIFFTIIWIFSKYAIRPVVRNMEAQEQFITNAGHELKTPLTIISANTEVIEMTNGKSEWTESIMNQVKRLSGLINRLMMTASLREKNKIEKTEVDFSDLVKDASRDFKAVIENQGKNMNVSVEDGLKTNANEELLKELVNILIDNAAKYCDENGDIDVIAKKKGKHIIFNVENSFVGTGEEDFSKFFERFYRADESHNSKIKGYGIGLSMAQTIVHLFGGRISASKKDEKACFEVVLPSSGK